MKFYVTVTVTGSYEVADNQLMFIYGTDDLQECIEIDRKNNPRDLLALCDNVVETVEVN